MSIIVASGGLPDPPEETEPQDNKEKETAMATLWGWARWTAGNQIYLDRTDAVLAWYEASSEVIVFEYREDEDIWLPPPGVYFDLAGAPEAVILKVAELLNISRVTVEGEALEA